MLTFIRIVKADILKLLKSPFFLIHVLVPVLVSGIFYLYSSFTNYDKEFLYSGYIQLVSISYPIIISVLTLIVTEIETAAGNCYYLFSESKHRCFPLISKLSILLICGLVPCLIIAFCLVIAIPDVISKSMSLSIGLMLWFACIPIYVFHVIVGFYFGRNINLGLGVFELLLAALMSTSLGDSLWYYFPSGYGIRLSSMWFLMQVGNNNLPRSYFSIQIRYGIFATCTMIILSLIVFVTWGNRWESRKFE